MEYVPGQRVVAIGWCLVRQGRDHNGKEKAIAVAPGRRGTVASLQWQCIPDGWLNRRHLHGIEAAENTMIVAYIKFDDVEGGLYSIYPNRPDTVAVQVID